jgi:uncharacterized protein YjiS (DUF1127 family)
MLHVNISRFTDPARRTILPIDGSVEGYPDMSGFSLSRGGVRRTAQARPRQDGQPGRGWLDWMALMLHAMTTRRHLAVMDDRMLRDIGVSRSEALYESARAPWDMGPRAQ